MMSQTAQLLQRIIPPLPKGKARIISSDPDRRHGTSDGQAANDARNAEIRDANIERVYIAVRDGFNLIQTIADETDLSVSTVNKALHYLEDWPGGPRIERVTGTIKQKHLFRITARKENPHE